MVSATRILWLRLIIGAVLVEMSSVIALVVVVAVFGPNEATAAQAYAERLGRWVGPIAGAVFTFAGAFLMARRLPGRRLLHGALFGFFVALVDVAILVAMQAPFEWLFLISDVLKLAAGYLGGIVAVQSAGSSKRQRIA